MKRICALLLLFLIAPVCGHSQFLGYTTPQTVTVPVFTNVTTAGISACIQNIGQNVHILNYTQTTATAVQIRLEGSFNSDGATCTTGTWIPISDDATDHAQGQVVAVGAYPFLRANLLKCSSCSGLTALYSGTSASPTNLYGFYNPSQQVRKVLFESQSMGASANAPVQFSTPYGSTAGFIVFDPSGIVPAGSTISVTTTWDNSSFTIATFSLTTANATQIFPVPASSVGFNRITITYGSGGASGNVFSAFYVFLQPGSSQPSGTQPATTANSEATAAANTAVTTTLTVAGGQRGHLFHVSARCSAGTAQIQVKDGSTVIWSTGTAEVGTTSFDRSWNPAEASSPGNNLVITLSTCGVGNTGTLDVQGSVF